MNKNENKWTWQEDWRWIHDVDKHVLKNRKKTILEGNKMLLIVKSKETEQSNQFIKK